MQRRLVRLLGLMTMINLSLIAILVFAFYFPPPPAWKSHFLTEREIAACLTQLENGDFTNRCDALNQLIDAQAEDALASRLAFHDPSTALLARQGLQECWMEEEGPTARLRMEEGIRALHLGQLQAAETIFAELGDRHPKWAEVSNKMAAVLYYQGRTAESMALCRKVVAIKPHHFSAWNGLAQCAIELQDWSTAIEASRMGLRLSPHSSQNRQRLRFAESQLIRL
jgi:tetratricopeptide (TPR) repeat protein